MLLLAHQSLSPVRSRHLDLSGDRLVNARLAPLSQLRIFRLVTSAQSDPAFPGSSPGKHPVGPGSRIGASLNATPWQPQSRVLAFASSPSNQCLSRRPAEPFGPANVSSLEPVTAPGIPSAHGAGLPGRLEGERLPALPSGLWELILIVHGNLSFCCDVTHGSQILRRGLKASDLVRVGGLLLSTKVCTTIPPPVNSDLLILQVDYKSSP